MFECSNREGACRACFNYVSIRMCQACCEMLSIIERMSRFVKTAEKKHAQCKNKTNLFWKKKVIWRIDGPSTDIDGIDSYEATAWSGKAKAIDLDMATIRGAKSHIQMTSGNRSVYEYTIVHMYNVNPGVINPDKFGGYRLIIRLSCIITIWVVPPWLMINH